MTQPEPFFLYSHCMSIHDSRFGVSPKSEADYATFLPPAVSFIKTAFGRVEAQNFDNDMMDGLYALANEDTQWYSVVPKRRAKPANWKIA